MLCLNTRRSLQLRGTRLLPVQCCRIERGSAAAHFHLSRRRFLSPPRCPGGLTLHPLPTLMGGSRLDSEPRDLAAPMRGDVAAFLSHYELFARTCEGWGWCRVSRDGVRPRCLNDGGRGQVSLGPAVRDDNNKNA